LSALSDNFGRFAEGVCMVRRRACALRSFLDDGL